MLGYLFLTQRPTFHAGLTYEPGATVPHQDEICIARHVLHQKCL